MHINFYSDVVGNVRGQKRGHLCICLVACHYGKLCIMVYDLRFIFGVLWFDGLDSGGCSWFQMGIDEPLLKILVEIWCALVPQREFMNEWTCVVHKWYHLHIETI